MKGAPQHNGSSGIVEDFDAEKKRYRVRLDGSGSELSLKPDNLALEVQGVKLVGIQSHQDLNGTPGIVKGWDAAKERYTVTVRNGAQVIGAAPVNVILPNGTRASVFGLTGSAQYNGRWGKVERRLYK